MDSNMKTESKKLGFYLSFKRSEKEIYEEIKSKSNYTQIIKELIKDYLSNQNNNSIKNSDQSRTINLSIDDVCKIISSVNLSNNNPIQSKIKEEFNDNVSTNSTEIPEDMLIGLY